MLRIVLSVAIGAVVLTAEAQRRQTRRSWPHAPGAHRRALAARRRHRHHRARDGGAFLQGVQAAVLRREPPRRRQHDRHRERRPRGARRLHLPDDGEHAVAQLRALQEGVLRPDQGFRADHARRDRAERADRQSVGAGEDADRVHRARQEAARQAHLRHARHRHLAAHVHGAVQEHGRRRPPAHPLSRHGAGAHRRDERPDQRACSPPRSSAKPQIEAGKVRALGVSTATRSGTMPDIPAIAEAGVPGYEAVQWYGFLAPAGTPAAIIAQIHAEAMKALNSAEMKEKLALDGAEPSPSSPEAFAAHIRDEIEKWRKVDKGRRHRAAVVDCSARSPPPRGERVGVGDYHERVLSIAPLTRRLRGRPLPASGAR